jgi:acyl-homoserine lactone acylase PvdQ
MTLIGLAMASIFALFWLYDVKQEGELVLDNAWGEVTIAREEGSEIPHITGGSLNSVVYAQGFAHA